MDMSDLSWVVNTVNGAVKPLEARVTALEGGKVPPVFAERIRDLEAQLAAKGGDLFDASVAYATLRADLARLTATDATPLGWVNTFDPKGYVGGLYESAAEARKVVGKHVTRVAVPVYEHPPRDVFAAFVEALKADREMQWAYHCNVAMAAYDKGVPARQANESAAVFLERLLGDYTPLHDDYLNMEAPRATAVTDASDAFPPLAFVDWLVREMPQNTIIGDAKWWAPRIWRMAVRNGVNRAAPEARVVGACVVRDGKITDTYTFSTETQEKRESYAASWAAKNGGTAHQLLLGAQIATEGGRDA